MKQFLIAPLSLLPRIPVHRAVLSANNDYFSALFSTDMLEKHKSEITLNGIEGKILHQLIEFCYTGSIVVDPNEIDALLVAASFYQFTELMNKLMQMYSMNLNVSNCLETYLKADRNHWFLLRDTAFEYVLEYFLEVKVIQNEQFKNLSADQLARLLQSDDLYIFSERNVFIAMMIWLRHDLHQRGPLFGSLMKHIRVEQLNQEVTIWIQSCLT